MRLQYFSDLIGDWPTRLVTRGSERFVDDSQPRASGRCSCAAYPLAVLRGTSVDQPRNLAKSVTVE